MNGFSPSSLFWGGALLLLWGAAGLAAVAGYPLWLRRTGGRWRPSGTGRPVRSISVLLVGRRAGRLLGPKLRDTLQALPSEIEAEILAVSDGPDSDMRAAAAATGDRRIRYVETSEWIGKNAALTLALPLAMGEVLVFTDMDARLDFGALRHLLDPFRDREVGGVCGLRRLDEDPDAPDGQCQYARWDASIKALESARGSLTSNDGKLYAVRRDLVRAVPDGVTDDLFLGLEVVRRGYRLCHAPGAVARIPQPVRSLGHEWSRRRRIVSRGLRGLWFQRELLNPRRHGGYATRLFVNKGLRRLLGLHLLLLIAGAALVASAFPPGGRILVAAAGAGAVALTAASGRLRYALIGSLACLSGLVDACLGRGTVRWEPRKGG